MGDDCTLAIFHKKTVEINAKIVYNILEKGDF